MAPRSRAGTTAPVGALGREATGAILGSGDASMALLWSGCHPFHPHVSPWLWMSWERALWGSQDPKGRRTRHHMGLGWVLGTRGPPALPFPPRWHDAEDPSQSALCDCCDSGCPPGDTPGQQPGRHLLWGQLGGFGCPGTRGEPHDGLCPPAEFPGEGMLHRETVGPLLVQDLVPWYEGEQPTPNFSL